MSNPATTTTHSTNTSIAPTPPPALLSAMGCGGSTAAAAGSSSSSRPEPHLWSSSTSLRRLDLGGVVGFHPSVREQGGGGPAALSSRAGVAGGGGETAGDGFSTFLEGRAVGRGLMYCGEFEEALSWFGANLEGLGVSRRNC